MLTTWQIKYSKYGKHKSFFSGLSHSTSCLMLHIYNIIYSQQKHAFIVYSKSFKSIQLKLAYNILILRSNLTWYDVWNVISIVIYYYILSFLLWITREKNNLKIINEDSILITKSIHKLNDEYQFYSFEYLPEAYVFNRKVTRI